MSAATTPACCFSPCLLCGEPAAEEGRDACASCSPRACFACDAPATLAHNGGSGGLTFACAACAATGDVAIQEWVTL